MFALSGESTDVSPTCNVIVYDVTQKFDLYGLRRLYSSHDKRQGRRGEGKKEGTLLRGQKAGAPSPPPKRSAQCANYRNSGEDLVSPWWARASRGSVGGVYARVLRSRRPGRRARRLFVHSVAHSRALSAALVRALPERAAAFSAVGLAYRLLCPTIRGN